MEKLTKEAAKKYINRILNFIDSGEVQFKNNIFYGHPGFYFFHTKEELDNKVDQCLNRDFYDRYDIYYITNLLINYMLGKYDSHTQIKFNTNNYLPIQFKIQNGHVYIVNHSPDLDAVIGSIVLEINDIDINKILGELEKITGYSTNEFLKTRQESSLCNLEILRSLPSINSRTDNITFKILQNNQLKAICFNSNNQPTPFINVDPENYSYGIIDDCIIIHYNACRDKDKMSILIENIKVLAKENNTNNYIVDLRNNEGGDSLIVKPLIDYLNGKNIVVLINEKVFSSGRMAFVELKKIGAYAIGTDISTSLNAFGNVPGKLEIKDLDLFVQRSSTYWLYDSKLKCTGYRKDSFFEHFKSKKELLEPVFLHPDLYVDLSVDDIIQNNDSQLNAALQYFKKEKRK